MEKQNYTFHAMVTYSTQLCWNLKYVNMNTSYADNACLLLFICDYLHVYNQLRFQYANCLSCLYRTIGEVLMRWKNVLVPNIQAADC